MGDFEYIFSFYSLLVGLAIANVASGFGDMWRERKVMPIGICTPLLAIVVLLGGMNVWLRYWYTQHGIHLSQWWLLSAAGVTLPFIFVSRAMFPAVSEPKPLEDHYMAQRHVLLGALVIPPAVSAASNIILSHSPYSGWSGVWITARIASPMVLTLFNNRIVQRIGLLAMIGLLVAGLFRW